MSEIAGALAAVRARIAAACERSGRDPARVTLVAVSKTQSPDLIREAYAAEQRVFGENYVQEMSEKARALSDLPELSWHFIGHLQRNKVKDVLGCGRCVIETLDSVRLADAIAARAGAAAIDVLIQVNVGGEAQKAGCSEGELPALLAHARALPQLRVRGLMTVPPASADPEEARPFFRRLAELAREHGLSELSIGMSADLEVAIEEGATLVRVGTAIFGARRAA